MIDKKFRKLFPKGIRPGIVPFAHKGEWAVHELLPVFYSQYGPFDLSLATFNVSEDSLRPIYFMKDRGEILQTRFIFDNNVQRHKLDLLLFSSNIANDVHITANHMKLTLCQNDKMVMCIIGSANMNRNIRHESGLIITDKSLFAYFNNYFNEVFENDSIPFIIENIWN